MSLYSALYSNMCKNDATLQVEHSHIDHTGLWQVICELMLAMQKSPTPLFNTSTSRCCPNQPKDHLYPKWCGIALQRFSCWPRLIEHLYLYLFLNLYLYPKWCRIALHRFSCRPRLIEHCICFCINICIYSCISNVFVFVSQVVWNCAPPFQLSAKINRTLYL